MEATSAIRLRGGESNRKAVFWSRALALFVLIVTLLSLYFPSFVWMAGEWSGSSGAISHGYLVAAISVYLLARSANNFTTSAIKPAWWAIPIVLGLSLAWLLAFVANVVAVHTIVLPVLMLAAAVTAFGWEASRTIAFPILYFSFALPAWEHLQFIFQAVTVRMVHGLIWITDIPAYVEGNSVFLGAGTFLIAGGCSGLSFILAGLSLAVLYGHLYYSSWQQKIILVAATTLVAMIGNWIRVFMIIVIGYESEMQSSLIDDHLTFGWILFGILMVPIVFFAQRLEKRAFGERPVASIPTNPNAIPQRTPISLFALIATMTTLAAGPVWAMLVTSAKPDRETVSLVFPEAPEGWRGPSSTEWGWRPKFIGTSAEQVVGYQSGTETVLAYQNIYLTQEQGQEPIYYANDVKGDWSAVDDVQIPALATAGVAGTFHQLNARSSNGTWLIWYRYSINNKQVTSALEGKVMQAIATLRGSPEAGVIAFASRCNPSCEETQSLLAGFVTALGDGATVRYKTEEHKND